MATTVEEKDRDRVSLLLAIYELTDGNENASLYPQELSARLNIDMSRVQQAASYLKSRGLVNAVSLAGDFAITARGIDQAEDLLRKGTKVTSSVMVLNVEEQKAVEVFLTAYRQSDEKGELKLDPEQRAEADASVATIEAQRRSPKPKRRIVKLAVEDLHGILLNIAASAAYVELVKLSALL